MIRDLHAFIDVLRRERELAEISVEVDPYLEAAEIHRRVIAEEGPALLFRNIKGASFPLLTNMFGNRRRMELAFGPRPEEIIARVAKLPEELLPLSLRAIWESRGTLANLARTGLKRRSDGPVLEVTESPRLSTLPLLTTWQLDGGPFFTLPLVYSEHPLTHIANFGMYRLQRFDDMTTGFHCQIGKGAGFHLSEAQRLGAPMPVHVTVGGPPALVVAAAAPLPENVPELLLASLMLGSKLPVSKASDTGLPIILDADFVLVGEVSPDERRPEGPFGDHYGYYSLQHDYPVFHVKRVHRRKNAICTATVVGKGRQEDCWIGDYLQDLLSPIFPLVMPSVRGLRAYGETGYHSLAAAVVKQQRYKREALAAAFRILGEGQLSLTKFLLVIEKDLDLRDFRAVLEHVLERSDFSKDLYILSNTSMDTLDYTSTRINEGSKGILLGLGDPIRVLPASFHEQLPAGLAHAEVFCRGCLVVSGPSFAADPDLPSRLPLRFPDWPLIVAVDDAAWAAARTDNFLWNTFTRFEPAADIHAADRAIVGNQVSFTAPIVIDARMKPGYPDELFCDEDTARLVDRRWSEYF